MNYEVVALNEVTEAQIEVLRKGLSEKNFKKALAAIGMINESARAGGWLKGQKRTAEINYRQKSKMAKIANDVYESLYQEMRNHAGEKYAELLNKWKIAFSVYHAVTQYTPFPSQEEFSLIADQYETDAFDLLPEMAAVNAAIAQTVEALNNLHPKPVITPVGLSPKVQATLLECNLSLDLATIQYPKMEARVCEEMDKSGRVYKITYYVPIWPDDTQHGMSRFAGLRPGCCEACGKTIPSGRMVPVQVKDIGYGCHVSLWVGEDCAKKIFGIKANGITKI